MKFSLINKIGSSIDFANQAFFIIAGMSFFFYILNSGKYMYLLMIIAIYLVGLVFRFSIIKPTENKSVSEPARLFLAATILGYILYIFKLDPEITDYIPNTLIVTSSTAYIFIVLRGMITIKNEYIWFVVFVILLYWLSYYEKELNNIFVVWPQIVDTLVGIPILYLILVNIGVDKWLPSGRNVN